MNNYSVGYKAIFNNKAKKKSIKECPCTSCHEPKGLVEQSRANKKRIFIACVNKKCEKYRQPPEVVDNCGSHETFSYRAGQNMEKAKADRRYAEEMSHMGKDVYNNIDDLNNDAVWGEIK